MKSLADQLTAFIADAYPRLRAISELKASAKVSPGQWSMKEIMGHLIDSASNNHQRFVRMQEIADIGTFTYSQNHWVAVQQYQAEPWPEIIELWYRYNAHLARVIAAIAPEYLGNTCDIGKPEPVTLKFITEDYLRHLRHHLDGIFNTQK